MTETLADAPAAEASTPAYFTCSVNRAGPVADASGMTRPAIFVNLTDAAGQFDNQWFIAADDARAEMLTVAIAAITHSKKVNVVLVPPNPGGSPFTPVLRMYIVA
jgi:hypothetical protein